MAEALKIHQELFLKFRHPIETRRIHLARNIASILNLSGQTEEGFLLSIQLIQYTISDQNPWPLSYCQLDQPNSISTNMKMFVVNQLIKEMDNILSQYSSIPSGLIFTIVWAFNEAYIDEIITVFKDRNLKVCILELNCDLEERLKRNKHEHRLKHKASKRNVESSEK